MKNKIVQIRLTELEFEELSKIAAELNCTKTNYIITSMHSFYKLISMNNDIDKINFINAYKTIFEKD